MNVDLAFGWEALEIIWINILLSGDNAILIALACRQLPPEQQRLGVFLGALGGVILRVAFTLLIVQIMSIPLLKTAGGLLLLGVAVKLLVDETDHSHVAAKPDLMSAVMSIIVADAVMSLDNVLAIAAAARGEMKLITFGLAVSVPIVMFGAGFLLHALERFPILVWAGAAVLGWVAGDMIGGDEFLQERSPVDPETLETCLSIAGCGLTLVIASIIKFIQYRRQEA
jgi:YjbE family integral membrane protein